MGLDAVEIVMRVEEIFAISLSNQECAKADTVGDMFRLVLEKLQMPYQTVQSIKASGLGQDYSGVSRIRMIPWTAADVWVTMRGVIRDQLQVDPEDIVESASFVRDLGCG